MRAVFTFLCALSASSDADAAAARHRSQQAPGTPSTTTHYVFAVTAGHTGSTMLSSAASYTLRNARTGERRTARGNRTTGLPGICFAFEEEHSFEEAGHSIMHWWATHHHFAVAMSGESKSNHTHNTAALTQAASAARHVLADFVPNNKTKTTVLQVGASLDTRQRLGMRLGRQRQTTLIQVAIEQQTTMKFLTKRLYPFYHQHCLGQQAAFGTHAEPCAVVRLCTSHMHACV